MSSKVTSTDKEQSPESPPSRITSLPDDIIVDIIARVPRGNFPKICLVSKSFRSIIASSGLYKRRSLLGFTEQYCLYAVLYNYDTDEYRSYILRRTVYNSNRLVIIRSFPSMPCSASYLTVGSKIYVVDSSSFLSIDCRTHMVQPITQIPKPMSDKVSGIDGNIYLIGNRLVSRNMWKWNRVVMVLKTQTMIMPDLELYTICSDAVVMEDKIYMRDSENSFVYRPKEIKWERGDMLNSRDWNHWCAVGEWERDDMLNSRDWNHACAVGDLLCYYDVSEKMLRAYDTKERCWRVVNGLEKSLPRPSTLWCNMVSYDGKLAMFFHKYIYNKVRDDLISIWCAEIALERRQGGEIWGTVLWYDAVIEGSFAMVKCLAVPVG
ncbi:hypothetical protein EUTSA_v10029520mg [Eutrema salsugineum]|uniref:F-box domain-containing protein n=1 Tax=Eutrema salsugineum TaxID=72664 RepID=V4KL88_EUTSA|nr:F-box/kelch-repeat protein At4g38940 [Eutrema salsugineum]ESQ38670.1 hypothetical protein EUTSA_v10029520mg [Eutrema salsugineum]